MRGNTSLCSSNQYVLNGIPSSATINWSYETNIQQIDTFPILHLSSTTSSSITVQRGTYRFIHHNISGPEFLYSGYVTLKATVTYGGITNVYAKTLYMHEDVKPSLPASSLLVIGWQETRTFTINNCTNVPDNKLKWIITLPQATTTTTYYGRSWTVTPTTPGTLNIKLYNLENCSTSLYSNYNVEVDFRIPVELRISHANPVTTASVNIHIEDINYSERINRAGLEQHVPVTSYTLELWDDESRVQKTINGTISGAENVETLDVGGLKNGIYLLTLKVEGQIVQTSKMIINR